MFGKLKALPLEKQFLEYHAVQHLTACNNKLQENTGAVVLACAYLSAC